MPCLIWGPEFLLQPRVAKTPRDVWHGCGFLGSSGVFLCVGIPQCLFPSIHLGRLQGFALLNRAAGNILMPGACGRHP